MTYENKEKRIELANKKQELESNIAKEYISSDSLSEFVMNCSIKYGYSAKSIFNKYQLYYHMADLGKGIVILKVVLGIILVGIIPLIAGIFMSSEKLICFGILLSTAIPLSIGLYLDFLYDIVEAKLFKAKEEL